MKAGVFQPIIRASSSSTAILVAALASAAMSSASALPLNNLYTSASGAFFIPGSTPVGPFLVQESAVGPVEVEVEAGKVLKYGAPDFPPHSLEATLYAGGLSRADYGTNAARVQANLRATNGTDRGSYESIDYQGNLPDARNSSSGVSTFAESVWRDVFIITGGTGVGTATVNVALHGHAQTRYGANGTTWYDLEPSLETFGRNGYGFANYSLRIDYEENPPGYDPENGPPIHYETGFAQPLPDFVTEVGPQSDTLTGTFVFEYDAPFMLSSFLSISGYNQIDIDFGHTATLSGFGLPDGSELNALSGHQYLVITAVPEPTTLAAFGVPLLYLAVSRRRRRSQS